MSAPMEFPERFNMAWYFLDRNVEEGRGGKRCLFWRDQALTYREVQAGANRAGNALRALGVALLAAWNAVDSRWETVGYASQMVTLFLAQGLMAGRIALRLVLWAGQIVLLRRFAQAPWDAVPSP